MCSTMCIANAKVRRAVVKDKILKIQNKGKCLMWGFTRHSETETMFCVGHKRYPCQVHYFVVSDDYRIHIVSREHRLDLVKSCCCEGEVLEVLYGLLKQWFPTIN